MSYTPNLAEHASATRVTLDAVRAHQAALQAIADANGGNRISGTPGYDASVAYVQQVMTAAGYDVMVQPFRFQTFVSLSRPALEQVAPTPTGTIANTIVSYSGSGDVTASVTALAGPPSDETPGCEPADIDGFPAGNIVLVSRSNCTFALKATNAYAAGASGVVIYNDVAGDLNATLGSAFALDIPVTSVTEAVGEQLAAAPGLVMRLKTDAIRRVATTYNILAETPGGDPNNVVMVGSHLDSVVAGPGIQDNGSGSGALVETALQMARVKPRNKVRFAWWGAEETSLKGSTFYVNRLSEDQRNRIALYLNFDMIASPNYGFFIYDGDDSDGVGVGPGPAGSAQIEDVFETYFSMIGQATKGIDLIGTSDHAPFIAHDIPVGGLFTGAEVTKTAAEAVDWGGTAGVQFDPCYHLACDTYDNVSLFALEVNSDAVAYAVLRFAMSTQAINGKRGKGNTP